MNEHERTSLVRGRHEVRQEYAREDVARTYIESRFETDLLGRAQHERQVLILRDVIARVAPRRLLEIAPGPARLTVHAPPLELACAVEQSAAMLSIAKARLREAKRHEWRLIRGDAFHLPVGGASFDMAMTFRFMRHWPRDERATLLAEIRRILRPGGALLLDVASEEMYAWWFEKMGLQAARVDDYWFSEESFREEMEANGFKVGRMYPVQPALRLQFYLWTYVAPRLPRFARAASRLVGRLTEKRPLEWMALCRSE